MVGEEGLVVAAFLLPPSSAQDHPFIYLQSPHLVEGDGRGYIISISILISILKSKLILILMFMQCSRFKLDVDIIDIF